MCVWHACVCDSSLFSAPVISVRQGGLELGIWTWDEGKREGLLPFSQFESTQLYQKYL